MSRALQPGILILGAGQSRRMGRSKLLLPWRNTTVMGHLVAEWRGLGAEPITVVTAPGDETLGREMDRLQILEGHRILNPDPGRGMFSSIQAAAKAADVFAAATHVVIALGDQPYFRRQTLEALLQFASENPEKIVQPSFQARPKHPVIFPAGRFRLLASSAAETLKQFLLEHSIAVWPSDDPGLALDLDTPDDYARALKLDISRTD